MKSLLALTLAVPLFAQSELVVDRGLPKINLNNASGSVRSNVRWGWHDKGFLGDDFKIGSPGERWIIDGIRTWTVPGTQAHHPDRIGDAFQDVRLYFGSAAKDLTPVIAGGFNEASDANENPNIQVTEATQNGEIAYDDFGASLRVWQVEFRGLNISVNGGETYRFGVWGLGRDVPGEDGKRYIWYNHASNAELSGGRQDGADGAMLIFDGGGRFQQRFQAKGEGWDKNADINVQVFAHRVPAGREGAPTRGR
ncbi:MAG TPA: hypothetical protein VKE70_06305 [Candidatus Solibacter sp.]|nr:hypothetical protein [Candidatus Solibacter sp.]